jgi:MFS family permease
MSQASLLKQTRFMPLFITQFFGAFNDNVFKNTFMLILAYSAANKVGIDSNVLLNLAAGLFILPFLLFSGIAGEISDRYEKSSLVRKIKFIEVIIMLMAAIGLYFEQYIILLFVLFLMGAQSTIFGPIKYALLPQHLHKDELIGGNALIEMATFVAILLGTIFAGFILLFEEHHLIAGVCVLLFALIGFISSKKIPFASPSDPDLKINPNFLSSTWSLVVTIRKEKAIFRSIIAISWFWFLGASYLTQFPNFARVVLNGDTFLVTTLLALFTLGIGTGSLLVERLSRGRATQNLVYIGLVGLTIFGADLFFSIPETSETSVSWWQMFVQPVYFRIAIDILGIGIFGGIFIVPLYAFVQAKAQEKFRARTIAVINIINALFMVSSAGVAIVVLGVLNWTIPQFFLLLAILNLPFLFYLRRQVIEI